MPSVCERFLSQYATPVTADMMSPVAPFGLTVVNQRLSIVHLFAKGKHMTKHIQHACIVLITIVNIVCAILCVRAASQPSRSTAVSSDIEAIRTAVDQQTAVLDRAIGNVVPVK